MLANGQIPSNEKERDENELDLEKRPSSRKGRNGKRSRKKKIMKFNLSRDLWISPTLNLRGRHGDRAWDRSGNLPPGAGMRLLELADIALGLKKHTPQAKAASAPAHQTTKSEPYSL